MPSSRFQKVLELVAPYLPGNDCALTLRSSGDQFQMLYVGGATQSLSGLDDESLEASPGRWDGRVHPDDADRLAAALRSVTEQVGGSVEYRIVSTDGTVRWLREDLQALTGSPMRVFGVVKDVSKEHELEEAVTGLEERLWRAQRMEALGALLGGVASEFSGLLNTILATAPLVAEDEGLSVVSRANMRIVEGAAARGSALVDKLLQFGTRQRGGAESAHVATLARGLEPVLARMLGKDVRLHVRSDGDLWSAACDPVQVEQVIFNLILNARDAMPRGGEITIGSMNTQIYTPLMVEGGVLPVGRYVHVVVADGGSGIPRDDRIRLFDGHYTTKEGTGAGFGLWTVNRIVRSCGGGLTVESREDEGSTFHVYLPCEQRSALPLQPAQSAEAERPVRGLRILIVDDDALVGGVFERALVREGHSVVVATSLREWLPTLGGPKPAFNLLIVDVGRLEESGGPASLAEDRSALPVIFTSRAGERALDRHPGLRQRGVFLPKPVEPDVLREAISLSIQRGSEGLEEAASG